MKTTPLNSIYIVSEFHKIFENIGSGNDADQFTFMNDRQRANFIFSHNRGGISGQLLRIDGHNIALHDIFNLATGKLDSGSIRIFNNGIFRPKNFFQVPI